VWSARIVGRKGGGSERTPERLREPVTIEAAREGDAAAIEALLAEVDLPAAEIREQIDNFLVARAGGRVMGCVGLELYGGAALLRSLAVLPENRGQGVGARLAAEILEKARRLGASEAVLLTTTVQAMAAAMGFESVPRESVPAEVRGSWEFKADCCGTATCMRLALSPQRVPHTAIR
jgi:amino-acid N-acetyltransferase